MIQKGSKVYIVPRDTRIEPYYRTVVSIGRKYITVDDNLHYNKFDILTKESVDDSSGWNPHLILYESKEAYKDIIEKRDKWLKLYSIISDEHLLQKATIEQLEMIIKMLKK